MSDDLKEPTVEDPMAMVARLRDCFDRLCTVAGVRDEGHLGFDQDLYHLQQRLDNSDKRVSQIWIEIADWVQHTFSNGVPVATIAHAMRERARRLSVGEEVEHLEEKYAINAAIAARKPKEKI
jgi:hypothetical protein